MRISLFTDAPKHNLALMKISAWHKARGDDVYLNAPIVPAERTYASYLFDFSKRREADLMGGIGFDPCTTLPPEIENMRPDYELYGLRRSLGYTFRHCPRGCPFCKVGQLPKDLTHHSIHEFLDPRFDVIELLNNNTFMDPLWENTFREIHEAGLAVFDDNGYDLRLLDERKAWWIHRLRWVGKSGRGRPKFAWDRMADKDRAERGLRLLRKHKVSAIIYVLMGFDTTLDEDLFRCQIIHDLGHHPYPMLYRETEELVLLRRMIHLRYYRKYRSIEDAYKDYSLARRRGAVRSRIRGKEQRHNPSGSLLGPERR